ncbi:uncharacterized protein LOC122312641 [Carya illinoinensis]|uniref:uncharacterized protein LOC122312641 n=1 Tax=Carya illinoinensis TaxID=32201 RepID=UPI001C722076|nr:uncharacterized protein LOC122312641 [Carya illinoinensis]
MNQLSKRELTEIAVTAKAVLQRRNTWIFENKFKSPSQVSKQVHAEMEAIDSWVESGVKQVKHQVVSGSKWSAPPPAFFKANWDAAIDKGSSKVGIGVIVRDSEGLVTASLCSSITLTPDPLLGEAAAALRATTLCAELGLTHIVLEGDALNVVQAVQGVEENWSAVGMVIRDVKSLLSRFQEWSIHHVPRELNVIAHTLAKYALICSEDCILLEDYPPCIQHLF